MIPRIIHYCWFGRNPLPPLAEKCIQSWRKFLPDYDIIEWNEDNFDVNIIPYTKEAYEAKKYAFVSDYARFWILYNYGGVYFDTDVELIRPIDDIILRGSFMGCENEIKSTTDRISVAPGLGLGCMPYLNIIHEMLLLYSKLNFLNENGSYNQKTIVEYTSELLYKYGLNNTNEIQIVGNIWIYPKDYFCPIDFYTKKCELTQNTRSIHHYSATWMTNAQKLFPLIASVIGINNAHKLSLLLKSFHIIK